MVKILSLFLLMNNLGIAGFAQFKKSEVFGIFANWLATVKRQMELKLQILKPDNRVKYIASQMDSS